MVGIFNKVKDALWTTPIKEDISKMGGVNTGPNADTRNQPVDPLVLAPASIFTGQMTEADRLRKTNRYLLADQLYWEDERLYSAVELMAIMIQKSIGGCGIGINPGEKMSNQEQNAVNAAEQWAKDIKLKQLFYYYTIDLWKYGDVVDVIKFNGTKGITGFDPLPMHAVTAIESREQVGKVDFKTTISRPNFYVLDEQNKNLDIGGNGQAAGRLIPKDRIFHVPFNNRRSLVRDNLNRWTLNIWSMPPITSLIGIIQWKKNLIRNDVLWRNRNVPREHHRLDLREYDPSKYTGTHSEKLEKSRADAQTAIENYATSNQRREADQGFVTGMGVEIGFIEPKTMTYADPMPIITQINELIGGPTGTPAALMGGTTSGFSSLAHSASFLALRAEIYATRIQDRFEDLMKRHIRLTHPAISDEIVNRLYIKNRLILDKDRTELAKIVAILTGAKVFTPDEIRAVWGVDPMTIKQSQDILNWIKDTNPRGFQSSPAEETATANDRNPDSPTSDRETPGQRDRNNMTQGDRRGRSPIG